MSETFEVISPRDVVVRTFDCPVAARKWVLLNKKTLPDLRIERVTIRTIREAVYTPRKRRAA